MEIKRKVRQGLDYRIFNKTTIFLEDGYGLFQKNVNLDAQEQ